MRRKQVHPIVGGERQCQPIVLLERFGNITAPKKTVHTKSRILVKKQKSFVQLKRKLADSPRCVKPPTYAEYLRTLGLSSSQSPLVKQEIPSPMIKVQLKTMTADSKLAGGMSAFSERACPVLSPQSGRAGSTLLPLMPRRRVSETCDSFWGVEVLDISRDDSEHPSDEDRIDRLLKIDLTSPMGIKLAPLLAKRQYKRSSVVKNYEQYCNRTATEVSDSRSLRSQTMYCDDRWSLNNIHYVRREGHIHNNRIHVFGRKERQKRYQTLKCRYTKISRRLIRLLKPCSVVLCRIDVRTLESFSSNTPSPSTDATVHNENRSKVTSPVTIRLQPQSPMELAESSITICEIADDETDAQEIEKESGSLRKALAPLFLSRSTTGWRCESPTSAKMMAKLQDMCGDVTKTRKRKPHKSFLWEDLVQDKPKVQLEMLTKPLVVDLTNDVDEELIQLPSPNQLLGNWHIPETQLPTIAKDHQPRSWPKLKKRQIPGQRISTRCQMNNERKRLLMQNTNIFGR